MIDLEKLQHILSNMVYDLLYYDYPSIRCAVLTVSKREYVKVHAGLFRDKYDWVTFYYTPNDYTKNPSMSKTMDLFVYELSFVRNDGKVYKMRFSVHNVDDIDKFRGDVEEDIKSFRRMISWKKPKMDDIYG